MPPTGKNRRTTFAGADRTRTGAPEQIPCARICELLVKLEISESDGFSGQGSHWRGG